METRIGIDILKISRFKASIKKGGDSFLFRTFTPQELRQNSPEQLASIFSLKEAIIKALRLPVDSWQIISTNRTASGKVQCTITDSTIASGIKTFDTSISHDGNTVVSVACLLLL